MFSGILRRVRQFFSTTKSVVTFDISRFLRGEKLKCGVLTMQQALLNVLPLNKSTYDY